MKKVNIAIIGATGAVGSALLEILAERQFPVNNIYALASQRSIGDAVSFRDKPVILQDLTTFDFSQVEIAFFAAGSKVSAEYAKKAVKAGCIVIDKSSQFRYDSKIPLVIPELNSDVLANYTQGIIASPNCSMTPIAIALKPIYDAVGIERINISTYQSVSGAGNQAIEELVTQTVDLLNCRAMTKPKVFSRQIAFNILPQIDSFEKNGYTKEEMKIVWEMQKIFSDDNLKINVTAVRVPVFYGHSAAVHIETKKKLSASKAKELLTQAPGIIVLDKHSEGGYPTPVTEASGQDAVYVGRIREDISHPKGLNLWVVTDNIRKGAALNAVQIAELVLKSIQKT